MKHKFLLLSMAFLVSLAFLFWTYRLTITPPGLLIDEASIGYNAVLLSKNLRDETGRFLPFFPLTIHQSDWKQPVTAYTTAIFFKVFGPSLYNLRLVSVGAGLISLVLLVYLSYLLFGNKLYLLSGLLFMTAPIVVLHTHLGQENIMPIPFTLLWLLFVYKHYKTGDKKFLFWAWISLGVGMYSYRGMRAIVPVWSAVTTLFLLLDSKNKIKNILMFALGLAPFVAIIPWLNIHYAGAVFESSEFGQRTVYNFMYSYLSSFDISALFIKGDSMLQHSTGIHGVFLLATLPLWLIGLSYAFYKDRYWKFLAIAFLLTPILFGTVESVYRFSRLLVFVPFYVLFSSLGIWWLLKLKRYFFIPVIIFILVGVNIYDFTRHYWFIYPQIERAYFYKNNETLFIALAQFSKERYLTPYIYAKDFDNSNQSFNFYEAAYFPSGIHQWKISDKLPAKSVLMTTLDLSTSFKKVGTIDSYFLYTSP